MMFGDGALTFREFVMHERLPLATIHDAVLDFLRGRDDTALYGAQAVNAYVDEARMTQDVDILSPRAAEVAEEIRAHLNSLFQIAVRVRKVRDGIGYRVDQVRKPTNRHLVDVRAVEQLPPTQRVEEVLVLTPVELIAAKVLSAASRIQTAKGLIDAADLRRLLLVFPELKTSQGTVADCLSRANAPGAALAMWNNIVAQEILPEDEDAGY
ncbi:MAG: nucleotidyl transferase AbiEii/AbiGii toxin family protein [Planctomycetaceae bacterium]